jgi:hypothetical protein
MTSLVSILAICYVLYAGCYMLSIICQLLYVEYHVLATVSLQSYQFTYQSEYQLLCAMYNCYMLNAICYMLYVKSRMLVIVYLYLYAGTSVSNLSYELPS